MNATTEILSRVRISQVYVELGGPTPRGNRVPAFWRGGDGLNVSLDDKRGVWHDFTTDDGGGVLDLVARVRGGSRADALRWCAELAGVPLEDKPLSPIERESWARGRRDLERNLPIAQCWQRAAISMTEELLDQLKAGLSNPNLPQPEIGEIRGAESLLVSLRRKDGAALIDEYRAWLEEHPGLTAALVASAWRREQAQRQAVVEYLRQTEQPRGAAA
jgi:hypothetical protein